LGKPEKPRTPGPGASPADSLAPLGGAFGKIFLGVWVTEGKEGGGLFFPVRGRGRPPETCWPTGLVPRDSREKKGGGGGGPGGGGGGNQGGHPRVVGVNFPFGAGLPAGGGGFAGQKKKAVPGRGGASSLRSGEKKGPTRTHPFFGQPRFSAPAGGTFFGSLNEVGEGGAGVRGGDHARGRHGFSIWGVVPGVRSGGGRGAGALFRFFGAGLLWGGQIHRGPRLLLDFTFAKGVNFLFRGNFFPPGPFSVFFRRGFRGGVFVPLFFDRLNGVWPLNPKARLQSGQGA